MALEKGIPTLRKIANFSRGVQDITTVNPKTSSRFERWHDNVIMDPDFMDNISYLGPMFKALVSLNFYGRLYPSYNYYIDKISYRIEKYIDLDEIM
jgi:hypothetical protein